MSDSTRPDVIAIVGPTAVGKSTVAEDLAMELGGEIVSADSMQVYRGMDIGTAKPTPPLRVPYHLIDILDPGDDYSAALYQEQARDAIRFITEGNRLPILAGGTGLYVRAALDDWDIPEGSTSTKERALLESTLAAEGPEAMHARLAAVDPESSALIHPNNSRRVLRALEMHAHGTSYAVQAERFNRRESVYDAVFIGLTMHRESLYKRIDARVDRMMERGLLREVEALLEAGFRSALTAKQAIGYKEFVPVIDGDADLDEAVAQVKTATRRYAKRQLTWFRGDPRVTWLDVADSDRTSVLGAVIDLVSSLRTVE